MQNAQCKMHTRKKCKMENAKLKMENEKCAVEEQP
jgi:hypothetical protein